ncbi:hypothetical protein J2T60_000844 [Natronospira proteinivora]|uniref:Uncharacterized protein n=1 Tax=Natronospira proteinivora TaxID=1807133 RepID=A0ABT1G6G4_9GAMM|nr:hypothetical protein [Natronospira proteinivora]MCP1726879.1 hypothetical protein [Natronospira proteinivora]
MANSDVGAKQLAMYADNPVRYCNLRGQLDGAGGAIGKRRDDDLSLNPEPLTVIWTFLLVAGLVALGLAINELFRLTSFRPLAGKESVIIATFLLGLALAILGAWQRIQAMKLKQRDEICARFELDSAEYRLVSAAIMGNRGKRFQANGVSAVPHALFQRRSTRQSYHVGLILNRPYAGKVHDGDLFRLTLHMGIIKREMGVRTVTGSIRYAGKLVKIAYSGSLYNSLKAMRDEYRESVRQWWPQDRLSLRQRQRIAAGAAVRAKEIEWPDEYSM